jgi:type IV pilus assembly protein PilA
VVFLIAMLLVPIGAILAAISISQYQDYVIRSQVSEGSSMADGVKTAVAEYASQNGHFPDSNGAAQLAAPASIMGVYVGSVDIGQQPGRIDITYSSQPPQKANNTLDGRHLYFTGEADAGSVSWSCASDDLPQKWCPSSCECTGSGASR